MDVGIDLGTATILVYIRGKGIVLREPSMVAMDKKSKTILAVGEEARRMLGRTPESIVAVRPLRHGVIHDYEITEQILRYFIKKASRRMSYMRKPRVFICVPSSVTGVQKRAVNDAARAVGAREVYVIEETIAAAIGSGLDISKPRGSMVVDIGGGTTDVAVLSLGGTVISHSVKVAGDDFDEAIIRYIRKKYHLLIGERTAEDLKINIGTAFMRNTEAHMTVRGRSLLTGLPDDLTLSSEEMREALKEPVAGITEAVHHVFERTPAELASDIAERGVVMTGGSSLLFGLDKHIETVTGIKTAIADNAINSVALGIGKYIDFLATT